MLSLKLLLPKRPEDPQTVDVDGNENGSFLRSLAAKEAGLEQSTLTLFARNPTDSEPLTKVEDDKSLTSQGVQDGALISCMVSEEVAKADGDADAPKADGDADAPKADGDADASKVATLVQVFEPSGASTSAQVSEAVASEAVAKADGDADASKEPPAAPEEEHEDAAKASAEKLVASALDNIGAEPGDEPAPVKGIASYTWVDREKVVKIHIRADKEPTVIAAAGDGTGPRVNAEFNESSLALTVRGVGVRHLLELRLKGQIVPDESRCVVTPGRGIMLELRKLQADEPWAELVAPATASKDDE